MNNRPSEHYYPKLNFRAILADVRLVIDRGRQITGLDKWRENSISDNNAQRDSYSRIKYTLDEEISETILNTIQCPGWDDILVQCASWYM